VHKSALRVAGPTKQHDSLWNNMSGKICPSLRTGVGEVFKELLHSMQPVLAPVRVRRVTRHLNGIPQRVVRHEISRLQSA